MFFLEINPLIKPEIGMVVWTTIVFLLLLFVLAKYAWKPILGAIKTREQTINDSLATAEKVKAEMTQLQSENEALLAKAREERALMLKEARETRDKIVNEAKEQAKAEANKIVQEAQVAIQAQKMAALTEVKNQIGSLVIEVSEKVLRRELSDKKGQEEHIQSLTGQIKLN
jgi:F-type H+-transporting ATPase subunit b